MLCTIYILRWLVKMHQEERAVEVLKRVGDSLLTDRDLENELNGIREAVRSSAEQEGFWEKLRVLADWKVTQR